MKFYKNLSVEFTTSVYLSHEAVNVVAARLSRVEPSLRKEVVEYMCDTDSHLWSMRRTSTVR